MSDLFIFQLQVSVDIEKKLIISVNVLFIFHQQTDIHSVESSTPSKVERRET